MTTIYGECTSGAAHAPVTISRLDRESCEIVLGANGATGADMPLGVDLALWIGAIGPFPITALPEHAKRNRRLTARFAQPLEPAILAHFMA